MNIYFSLLVIVLICLFFYVGCKSFSTFKKNKKRPFPFLKFEIDVNSNEYINDYVARMPQQYKDNSRVLKGTGKMHFVKTVSDGSNIVKEQTISVLSSVGDRFS